MIYLIVGASGSGKSLLAETLALHLNKKTYYVATMKIYDEECKKRVLRHKTMREGKGFLTIEAPEKVLETVENSIRYEESNQILLECLSNLLANEMFAIDGMNYQAGEAIYQDLYKLSTKVENMIIVSNEVFSDGNVYDSSTQDYIDALGRLNTKLATIADVVIESVYSIPVCHKGKEFVTFMLQEDL